MGSLVKPSHAGKTGFGDEVQVLSQFDPLLKQQLSCTFNKELMDAGGVLSRAGCIRKGQPSMDSAERPRPERKTKAHNRSFATRSFGRLGRFALSLLIVLAIAGSVSIATFGGANLANAAIEKAKSLAELINQRSPGQRTRGLLTKIKHKHKHVLRHERALPKVVLSLNFPPFVNQPALIDIVAAPPLQVPAAFESPPPISEAPPPVSGPPTILPPGEGLPVGPPIVSQPPPPTPPPPVPEPSTWMTMILGFGLLGLSVRRDSRRAMVN